MEHTSKWLVLWATITLWAEIIYLSSFIVPRYDFLYNHFFNISVI
jgi:hypothetical protein